MGPGIKATNADHENDHIGSLQTAIQGRLREDSNTGAHPSQPCFGMARDDLEPRPTTSAETDFDLLEVRI